MAEGLNGKVAVVTGASSGIGEATAEALANEGASVVVAARRKEKVDDLVRRIENGGGRALAVECDVSDEGQARRLIEQAEGEFEGIDILVNNAGVMLLSEIEKGLSDQWRQMLDANVLGLLYVTHPAIGAMRRRGSGHIVNVSSIAGRKVWPSSGVYSATKYATNAISEALRQELLRDNIRVTVVEPGPTATELVSHITDEEAKEAQQERRSIDLLQAEDIAGAIAYAVTRPARMSVSEVFIRPTELTM